MSRSGSARYRALEMANDLAKKGGTASDDLALFGAGFFVVLRWWNVRTVPLDEDSCPL
jgi:hypothetical protein